MSLGSSVSGVFGGQIELPQGADTSLVRQDLTNPINNAQVAQNGNIGAQQSLAQTLLSRANGQGPSAADALMNQGQGQAAAQAAGTFSANRSINSGLAARLAAQTQGSTAQMAANQGAQLKAQEAQGATGQLQNLYGQIGQQSLTGEGIYQQALANQNNAMNQQSAIQAGLAENNANNAQSAIGGLIQGGASAAALFAAKGGLVPRIPHYDYGGFVAPMPVPMNTGVYMPSAPASAAPMKLFSPPQKQPGKSGKAFSNAANGVMDATDASMDQTGQGIMTNDVQPMQPGLGVAAPSPVAGPSLGVDTSSIDSNPSFAASLFKAGGSVPGQAKVKGDSYKNDTVPAVLSPGEVVLPRHITESKNAPEAAKNFVQALMDKEDQKKQKFAKGGKVTPGQGLSAILQAQANLHDRMKKIEGKGKKVG